MNLSGRKPLDVGMGHQIWVGIKGDQIHCPYLGILQVTDDLPGYVVILEATVPKPNGLPGDIRFEISSQIQIDCTDRREVNPPDYGSLDPIVEKTLFYPTAVPEFL